MKSNKGMTNVIMSILVLGFVAFAGIFGFLFVKNFTSQEILNPISGNATSILENDYGNDTVLINMINSQKTNYDNIDLKVDLIFLVGWVSVIGISLFTATLLPKMNMLQFLLFLFLGIPILLYGFSFIDQIFTWLVQSFINDIFNSSDTYLPIFNFFVDNYVIIVLLNIVAVLFVNQLTKRSEEELSVTDDEDTQFQPIEEGGFNSSEDIRQ